MDSTFARKKLDEYTALLDEYSSPYSYGDERRDVADIRDALVQAQPTLAIVLRAFGQSITYIGTSDHARYEHREAILRARGVLEDAAELAAAQRPQGPKLRADGLHPWVWAVAAPLWASGHHRQAVAAAAGNLSLKVQVKLDRWDVADDALMTEALSSKPAEVGRSRLRVPATSGRPFEEALQSGTMFFARGVFSLLRNPATHNVTEVWSEQRALEALAALSVLARTLDEALVERVEEIQA